MSELIVGRPVVIAVDPQQGGSEEGGGIPANMPGRAERSARMIRIVERARELGVPVVFIQEVHKRRLVEIGRELDGAEGPHCFEDDPKNDFIEGLDPRPEEFHIKKRRYSAFFGTELEIVLKGYGADTLILFGGLTDVCVHYTAVDAHQHDYRVRVADRRGRRLLAARPRRRPGGDRVPAARRAGHHRRADRRDGGVGGGLSPLEALAVLAAGFTAGGINAIVGSGSLVTFPVLLAVGYAPVTANVSNSVGLVFGNVSAVLGLPPRARRPARALPCWAAPAPRSAPSPAASSC